MELWRPFDYNSLEDLSADIQDQGLDLPVSEDVSVLAEPIRLYGRNVKNRLAVLPMENFDGRDDGSPSELTIRRYRRFAKGGAGIIWMESTFTSMDSRSSLRMVGITEKNKDVFAHMITEIKEEAADGKAPFVICQLSHCGRLSNLDRHGVSVPAYIACENPYLPRENAAVLSDEQIYEIIDDYVKAAALCKEAGFDAVDIRACHGYLLSEMLSAYTRENSIFGGSFENRTRMLLTIIDRINSEVGIPIACRLNGTDLVPYPYGFGMKTDGSMEPDLTEPIELGRILFSKGVQLLNISLGRGHADHLLSPSDHPRYYPKAHQLTSIDFFQGMAAQFKTAIPEAVIMTGGFSWLKMYGPNVAAGGILAGKYDLAGFGKTALANPNFANDIIKDGSLRKDGWCLNCGMCGRLIGMGGTTGCVVRDKEMYGPIFRERAEMVKGRPMPPSQEKEYPLKLFELSTVRQS